MAQRGGDGEENFAENGLQAQTRNSHSGETGPGGASGGGRLRMRGDFAPHLDVTPSAGTCRGGASRMRMSGFGAATHFWRTVWKYWHFRSYCEAVFGGICPFLLHSMKKCAGDSYCVEDEARRCVLQLELQQRLKKAFSFQHVCFRKNRSLSSTLLEKGL